MNADIKKTINSCADIKPNELIIDTLKWKYLVRNVLRGKNILIVGPTGCGKSLAAISVAKALNKGDRFFYFNLGSTQDARCSLIGNTQYDKNTGTIFNESAFVSAIRTEGAIILLDEISRAHPDAWNILMTVLDDLQRYLRLDEKSNVEMVKVAKDVSFIATANIGNEYTSTRVMDRALLNRFSVKIEMNPLKIEDELKLLVNRFNITDESMISTLKNVLEICEHTRDNVKREDSKLTNFLSTRASVEMAELLVDGFNLEEIAENAIYPNFDNDGGVNSERTYIKQLVQKYINDPKITARNPFSGKKFDPNNITPTIPTNTQNVPF